MSWFNYGYPLNHRSMVGNYLRIGTNPDVEKLIKESGLKQTFDSVSRIVLSQYDKTSNVMWIEVWCKNTIDMLRKKHRYNVFYVRSEPNPHWVCEGDIGKGQPGKQKSK